MIQDEYLLYIINLSSYIINRLALQTILIPQWLKSFGCTSLLQFRCTGYYRTSVSNALLDWLKLPSSLYLNCQVYRITRHSPYKHYCSWGQILYLWEKRSKSKAKKLIALILLNSLVPTHIQYWAGYARVA